MRLTFICVLLACGALAACGTEEKTVVVNPPPGSTVVVPPNGDAHVVPTNH